MMQGPQGPSLTVRLGARLGPEIVASLLVVVVIVVALAVGLSGQRGSSGAQSPESSQVAVVPSATAAPPDSPVPSASPVGTGTPTLVPSVAPPPITPRPAQAAAALAVRDIVDRLIALRTDLQTEQAKTVTDSAAIADLLRDVNASIVQMDDPLADLAADPSTAGLASRIRAVNSATSETVSRIQHTSPRNAKTYRDGAAEVIEKLEPLPGLRAELAVLTG